MSKDTETTRHDAEVAQFRFALIAPVVQGLFPDASATAYYKRVTASPLTLPDGSTVTYSYKTLEKWKSLYITGGLDALMPNARSDKGIPRALNEDAIAEIYRIKEEHPRMNATQIHDHLIRESFIPATVSVDCVQRFIRHNDLKAARNPNLRDRKAYEEDAFGKIWQADTCYLPHITEDGRTRRVYCIMIIDDHSRLLVGGQLFYNDNACNFQKVLKDAIATYGIPDKLYVDNGCSYSNEQLSMICVSLGILLFENFMSNVPIQQNLLGIGHHQRLKPRPLDTFLDGANPILISRSNRLDSRFRIPNFLHERPFFLVRSLSPLASSRRTPSMTGARER